MAAESVPCVTVIGYVPGAEDVVAVVLKSGEPVTTLCLSPLTKPVVVAVKVGFAVPNDLLALVAVTVSKPDVTTSETEPDAGAYVVVSVGVKRTLRV